ncbi:Uncharacterized protein Adt_03298 [Abeliophyllum distichum]|uniref:Uncharacterized protein n=1 Tax=Abeliophyllum distichum TaxID=126358 RepID=A0ABD1VYI2_9LAMI
MSRVMSTNMPPLPQTQSNSTSTNRFVAPLSLRCSLKANRVVPSLSHTSQSPNTSIPPTRKIGTRSTTKTIVTCTTPLIETIRTHTHPEAPLRTLPNQGAQYGLPSDNLDRPPSRHLGCEQDSVIGVGRLPRTPDDVPTRGACKRIKTSRIEGSKFPEVDTFEFAYAGKNKLWIDSAAKAQHDEMLAKADEYLAERANEQQLPEDTPLEEIHVDDPDAGLKIMMSVLGVKPGRQIRGLGDGSLRDIDTSSNVHYMDKELEEERAARKAADAARTEIEQRMKSRLNVVGKQFNSTLESWYHFMQQLCRQVPGFILPPFTPLSVEDDAIRDEDNSFDKENNFGEDE